MKFAVIFGIMFLSTPLLASLVMDVQGTITAQYEIDQNNIAKEIERSFKGAGQVDAQLFGERIKRNEQIQKDLIPSTHFTASKKSDEQFEIRASHKVFVSAAKEILAPYVAMNRRDGMRSKVEYRLSQSNCERFTQSIICETRLSARLRGD